jgi:hypothetical protein
VGLHPCQMLLEGDTLSVANAYSDSVTVLAAADLRVIRTVAETPDPGLPFGSIVDALARDPRGGTLFAASEGTNAVGVIRDGACAGFVPAGWFPSCVAAAWPGEVSRSAACRRNRHLGRWDLDVALTGRGICFPEGAQTMEIIAILSLIVSMIYTFSYLYFQLTKH